jgi:hypothetical protein
MNTTNNGFGPTSRYASTPAATFTTADHREFVHLTRRFVPAPETLTQVREHVVIEGERLDLIAAQHLGDPTQFWQIADANGAFEPAQLTAVPGTGIRITLPTGIPGVPLV